MERKPLISGNWKMHHNHFEAIQMVQKLSYILNPQDYEKVDVSVHPPFTDLRSMRRKLLQILTKLIVIIVGFILISASLKKQLKFQFWPIITWRKDY